MARLKVDGYNNLVRDTSSNAVINSSTSEYRIYMSKYRAREQQSDELRNARNDLSMAAEDNPQREMNETILSINEDG